ncbi:cation transporter [Microbulbifer yueqingensis]|uniref:Cation diffusion facilitator family transporter n=1 Tax=Microbulbifer yueqingensis TaxID=658219 RepID=A0A1G9DXI1_9GAMM|nr:cation transporter [Microbulbifer yueqingensis]SDK68591.1 cation diffusion facilitator family transporter [Microbulbifer yueqingensis]
MTDSCEELDASSARERKTLIAVLAINAVMFVAELVAGLLAESTALIADSLDMLADASVYAISLYAVGRGASLQRRAARMSGVLQVTLALLVLLDVVRRFLLGSDPACGLMAGVGLVALAANIACLLLVARHRDAGVHMRASVIFSANDVIANLGVIASAGLVWWLDSRYPDLVIGVVIAVVVFLGGIRILRESARSPR